MTLRTFKPLGTDSPPNLTEDAFASDSASLESSENQPSDVRHSPTHAKSAATRRWPSRSATHDKSGLALLSQIRRMKNRCDGFAVGGNCCHESTFQKNFLASIPETPLNRHRFLADVGIQTLDSVTRLPYARGHRRFKATTHRSSRYGFRAVRKNPGHAFHMSAAPIPLVSLIRNWTRRSRSAKRERCFRISCVTKRISASDTSRCD